MVETIGLGLIDWIIINKLFNAKQQQYNVCVFAGKTGSGKTALAVSFAIGAIKKGYNVYSSFYIKGAYKLPRNWYEYNFPKDSILIIDESQNTFDSRNFKELITNKTSEKLKKKMSMHRHYHIDIWFITQRPEEIDAQIRRYCTCMYYTEKLLFRKIPTFKDKKLSFNIVPYFQIYKIWPDIDTYDLYKKRSDPHLTPKDYKVVTKFNILTRKKYTSYITDQKDDYNEKLPYVDDIPQNKNDLISL